MMEDGEKRHSVGGDGGSTPRMESPRRQPQGTPADDIDQIMQ